MKLAIVNFTRDHSPRGRGGREEERDWTETEARERTRSREADFSKPQKQLARQGLTRIAFLRHQGRRPLAISGNEFSFFQPRNLGGGTFPGVMGLSQ